MLGPCSGGGFTKRSAPGGSRNGFLAGEACPWSRSGHLQPWSLSAMSIVFFSNGRAESTLFFFFFQLPRHRREREREKTVRPGSGRKRQGDRSFGPWSWIKMEIWTRMWLGAVVSLQLNIIGPRTSSQSLAERKNPTRWNFPPLGYYLHVLVCVFRVQLRVCMKSYISILVL